MNSSAGSAQRQVTVIRSNRILGWPDFAEQWQYRELLLALVVRNIKVRYKQTALGIAWALLVPFITMVVFSVIFGRLGKMPSDGLPYPLFSMAALLPWQLFSNALIQGSTSLVAMQGVLTKVYFPRIYAPLAQIATGAVDFMFALLVLLGLMLWFGTVPGLAILLLPFFMLLALLTALTVALWLSAINVQYRDVQFALPFVAQIWMFMSPVVYSSSMIPEEWRWLYMLNPMAGVIDGFRWSLLGAPPPSALPFAISLVALLVFLAGGLRYFDWRQRTLPDQL